MTFIAALSLIGNLANADIDTSLVKEMEARAIGPAATSGKLPTTKLSSQVPVLFMRARQPRLVEIHERRSN